MRKTAFFLLFLLFTAPLAADRFVLLKKVPSKHLTFARNVIVFLPKDYASSGRRYPVLYAHDGQNLFHQKTSFAGEWQLDENIVKLEKAGRLDGVIVVGVYNTAARMGEYTPTYIKPGVNKWVKYGGGGKLRAYGRFLTEELKPIIDKKFRTLKDRRHTGVMGSSLGGIASLYLLGWFPQVYSKAACISPSFWWDERTVLRDLPKLRFPRDIRIYMDGGWKEGADESSMVRYMRLVKNALNRRGLKDLTNLFYHEDPFGTHSEGAWARRGKWPVLYLFGKFRPRVKQVSLRIAPARIGVGDSSAPLAQVLMANGMPFTVYDGFRLSGSAAVMKDGRIIGKTGGTATLSLNFRNKRYSKTIRILPEGRSMVRMTIRLTGKDGPFFLEKQDKSGKWSSVPFIMDRKNSGTVALKGNAGTAFKIRFRNSKGKYAGRNGKVLTPRLTLTGSQTIRLTMKQWIGK